MSKESKLNRIDHLASRNAELEADIDKKIRELRLNLTAIRNIKAKLGMSPSYEERYATTKYDRE